MIKLIRYHHPPLCKTCFSTSEWIWHTKKYLVNLQKFWELGRPSPPIWEKFPNNPVIFFWERTLPELASLLGFKRIALQKKKSFNTATGEKRFWLFVHRKYFSNSNCVARLQNILGHWHPWILHWKRWNYGFFLDQNVPCKPWCYRVGQYNRDTRSWTSCTSI